MSMFKKMILFVVVGLWCATCVADEEPTWVSLLNGREDLLEQVRKAEEQAKYDEENPVDCGVSDELLVLSNKSFHTATRQCPDIFILIHIRGEENPFWANTEMELKAALTEIRRQERDIVGAVLDLKDNVVFARQLGVLSSHSARLYIRRVFYQYWGSLLRLPLAAFLSRAYEPPMVHLNTKESVEAYHNNTDIKVLVHTHREAPEVIACEMAAQDYLGSITFYHVTNARLAKLLDISVDSAVIHRPLMPPLTTRDLANIGRVVHTHRVPLLARIRNEDVHLMLQLLGKNPIVFAFVQSDTPMGKQVLVGLKQVAKRFSTHHPHHPALSFAWMDVLSFPDVLPTFMAQFGFNMHERHADLGIIDLRTVPAGALWYPTDDEPLTATAIEQWIVQETAGKIRFTYIDQIVPNFFGDEESKEESKEESDTAKAKGKKVKREGESAKSKKEKEKEKEKKKSKAKKENNAFHTSIEDADRDEL